MVFWLVAFTTLLIMSITANLVVVWIVLGGEMMLLLYDISFVYDIGKIAAKARLMIYRVTHKKVYLFLRIFYPNYVITKLKESYIDKYVFMNTAWI